MKDLSGIKLDSLSVGKWYRATGRETDVLAWLASIEDIVPPEAKLHGQLAVESLTMTEAGYSISLFSGEAVRALGLARAIPELPLLVIHVDKPPPQWIPDALLWMLMMLGKEEGPL